MAVVSATSNGATEDAVGSKAGWLSKKTQFTGRWRPAWFQIQQSKLLYGANEKTAAKTISLIGARVEAQEADERFGWTITPKNSKRTFFLRADSAEEQQEWMVAVCEAQVKSGEHATNACVVQ